MNTLTTIAVNPAHQTVIAKLAIKFHPNKLPSPPREKVQQLLEKADPYGSKTNCKKFPISSQNS